MNRSLVFITLAAAGIAVNCLMACGTVQYPSCGEYRTRPWDGATCRECVDARGRYAECSNAALHNR